ncbi:TetR/AcrR family transcriptional regulator [Sinomonas sp. P10A9]|uniref:TetR/AcrR family transcriptional regulator n=1 Tax=Sinomonas puerhi TaxID=3238584 RepID=A0AB39L3G6_9MICC
MRRVKGSTEAATESRRAQGEETRRRILQAAGDEFADRGYQAATMARIAERAGVAVQTVYFSFHNKPALLSALIESQVVGPEDPTRPEDTDWFAEMLARTDGAGALRLFAEGGLGVFERASVAVETARLAAPAEPAIASVLEYFDGLRRVQFSRAVEALRHHGALRADLSPERATDVLMVVASPQTYLAFTRGQGWEPREWAQWLGDALARLLLD